MADSIFLDFATKPKISYASSVARDFLSKDEVNFISKLTSDFSSLSVREQTTSKLLSHELGKSFEVVPDPTLLLSKEEQIHSMGLFFLVYLKNHFMF